MLGRTLRFFSHQKFSGNQVTFLSSETINRHETRHETSCNEKIPGLAPVLLGFLILAAFPCAGPFWFRLQNVGPWNLKTSRSWIWKRKGAEKKKSGGSIDTEMESKASTSTFSAVTQKHQRKKSDLWNSFFLSAVNGGPVKHAAAARVACANKNCPGHRTSLRRKTLFCKSIWSVWRRVYNLRQHVACFRCCDPPGSVQGMSSRRFKYRKIPNTGHQKTEK